MEAYLRDVCTSTEQLIHAVERMQLVERIHADLQPVWQAALQLAHGDMSSREGRIGYSLALEVLVECPETGCQGLASELLAELRNHEPALRLLA